MIAQPQGTLDTDDELAELPQRHSALLPGTGSASRVYLICLHISSTHTCLTISSRMQGILPKPIMVMWTMQARLGVRFDMSKTACCEF